MVMTVGTFCKAFNCLPDEGGLLDQDCYWVEALRLWHNAEAEREQRETKSGT